MEVYYSDVLKIRVDIHQYVPSQLLCLKSWSLSSRLSFPLWDRKRGKTFTWDKRIATIAALKES